MASLTDDQKKLVEYQLLAIEENMSERDFQRNFFEDLKQQFTTWRRLTQRQMEALNRMYERVTDEPGASF